MFGNILINRIKNSRDGRVLVSNFAYLSLLQVAGYVFPLLTLPYLAKVVGVEKFGELAFASSIVMYFEAITAYGFNYTAVRDIAQNRENLDAVSKIFSNVMCAKLLLMLLSFVVFLIGIYSIPFLYENRGILFCTFLLIPGSVMFPDWFFQAMEKMKFITIMNFAAKLLFTLLVFLFVKEESDYIYQPLLTASGYFVSGLFSLVIIKRVFRIEFVMPTLKDLWLTIKLGFNMFISLFLPNLYTNFSVTLLGFYGSNVSTGIYSSGKKFIDIFEQFSNILSRTFYPFLARRMDKHDLYVKISGGISILMGIFLFVCADLLVDIFYTDDFDDAATVIRIMSIAPFFLFLMNTYGTNYLVLKKKEYVLRNIVLACSLGGFLLAWVIVTRFDFVGVAITVTSVWGIRGVLTWFYAKRAK